jgi:tRNA-2-methylthio-N6-dimethylallyladenosine synthase
MKTYYLRSFGCQMNEHDAERIRAVLESEGLARRETPEDADVIVYNTCTVRQSADERLAGHLSGAARLKRRDPERTIVVAGCLPQAKQAALLADYPFVDVALGPQNLHRLAEALHEARTTASSGPLSLFDDGDMMSGDLPSRRERPFQAWVQVMSGCTNFCSYCIVPYVRGRERSRTTDTIVAEVAALVADGVREVTLLGQNVNAYGADLAGSPERPTFAGLLRRLDGLPGLARVRFMTSHPRDLSDELIAAVGELPTVCEHVHLPVQSGSDRILTAMNRGYTAEWYLSRILALRSAVPDVSITTDLIAGFPGETEDDLAATLVLVQRAEFDAAFTFVFSARGGTAAAAMSEQLPFEVKRERVQRLIAFTQTQACQRRARLVGTVAEVLVEGPSRQPGRWRGRSRQNVVVNFTGTARPGEIITVRITEATSTTLKGQA